MQVDDINSPEPPFDFMTLSESDFERSTGVMWAVLALQGLKSNMQRISGALNDETRQAWTIYARTLSEFFFWFRLEDEDDSGWVGEPELRHQSLLRSLQMYGMRWNLSHGTSLDEDAFREFLTAILEKFTAKIDRDIAGYCDNKREVALHARHAVARLFYDLFVDDVKWFLVAARSVPFGERERLTVLTTQCVRQIEVGISTYICNKTAAGLFGTPTPSNLGHRMTELIASPLKNQIQDAVAHYLGYLNQHGKGTLGSESSKEFNENAIFVFFFFIAELFSFESTLLDEAEDDDNDEDMEDEEEEEDDDDGSLPEHVVNHNFEQYTDDDWYAGQLEIEETEPDVLRGPTSSTVNHVSIPIGSTQEPCVLCGDNSPMRQLAACNHIICEVCLDAQLNVENECRYRCPFCRAEFFPDVPEDDNL